MAGSSALAVASLEAGAMIAADDHRHHQIARPVGLAVVLRPEQTVEADRAGHAQRGRDVAVRQRALDRQGLLAGGNHDAALQDAAQALDMLGRPVAQIEQRALAHALAVPIALAQQDGGRRIPVGDGSRYTWRHHSAPSP